MPFAALLYRYDPATRWTVSEGESGWNNTTRIAENDRGDKRVLRIYETHKDADKIAFEHDVLLKLSERALPFAVPRPLALPDGATFTALGDGTGRYAALFTYTAGVRPDGSEPAVAASIGEAVGRLSLALRTLQPAAAPAYLPCYELERTHPSCPGHVIAAFCEAPQAAFLDLKDELRLISDAMRAFQAALKTVRTLPHQLVHGDINDSNLLVGMHDRTQIAAILDFEFCTMELRAMEPAVTLAGLIGEAGSLEAAASFLSGFGSIAPLSEEEIDALPLLMRLRRLDVFVHFLGRYLSEVDSADVLRQQTKETAAGLTLLDRHEAAVRSMCKETMTKKASGKRWQSHK
ncbi:phosphotransferase [Cohnella rhizosphaerae]|uniref:Phosphotransferase n=1 Tax=Cohnella rhizosphaerae TaxID=1457232 RepID=A0A9X4KYL3_9BACL|nr:phosphotransferase [Cohnella rhizosphaerae]MDG0812873.1 phosphotransferase [Cohnella rhizosphaerae]